jgi:hypothetical protein
MSRHELRTDGVCKALFHGSWEPPMFKSLGGVVQEGREYSSSFPSLPLQFLVCNDYTDMQGIAVLSKVVHSPGGHRVIQ